MLNRKALASLCLIGLSAMGCSKETTSSKNIKTGGIAALIDVYADDSDGAATVHVKLVVGGKDSNTYVTLEGSDSLQATAEGKTKTLQAIDPGIYEASFTGVGEDTEFSVVLDRPEDETASDNSGTLPAPFALDDPMDDLSRADDDLPITWAPESGDKMKADIDGSCIYSYSKGVPDTGMYTVGKGTLDSTGGDKPEACDLDLKLERYRDGSADSKFDPESYFTLHQRRKASFSSNP
jgi:hypothetical protein